MLFNELVLHIPQILGQIYVVGLRIFKTQGLAPQGLDLILTVIPHLIDGRTLVYALTLVKELHPQVLRVEII